MSSFAYRRPASLDEALAMLQEPGSRALGGGTDLLPLIRERTVAPHVLVDLRRLPGAAALSWHDDGGLHIGASARLAHLARDPQLQTAFPVLAEACGAVGAEALRTMGTLGGNLAQRPRCWYFRHGWACLKRGGAGCPAASGENEYHAILGAGPCVAAHPSDPAVALAALDAVVHLAGSQGTRDLPIPDLYAAAAHHPAREAAVDEGEVITGVSIPAHSRGGVQSYEKVTQRAAFDFALVSLAALKRTDGEVRLVLGGVAPMPWRVTDSIEEDVASGALSDDDIETLAARALYDARPLAGNGYKVELATAVLRRGIARLVRR
jgi:xanthine dehydrogenase YagS FAD-binding subunit